MTLQDDRVASVVDDPESDLGKRLDGIGWGLFLLMLGGLWLIPKEWGVPEGAWLVGTGLIILVLSLVRYFNAVQVNGFMVFLGVLALGSGLSSVLGVDLPVFPILIIIVGVGMILKPLRGRMRS